MDLFHKVSKPGQLVPDLSQGFLLTSKDFILYDENSCFSGGEKYVWMLKRIIHILSEMLASQLFTQALYSSGDGTVMRVAAVGLVKLKDRRLGGVLDCWVYTAWRLSRLYRSMLLPTVALYIWTTLFITQLALMLVLYCLKRGEKEYESSKSLGGRYCRAARRNQEWCSSKSSLRWQDLIVVLGSTWTMDFSWVLEWYDDVLQLESEAKG